MSVQDGLDRHDLALQHAGPHVVQEPFVIGRLLGVNGNQQNPVGVIIAAPDLGPNLGLLGGLVGGQSVQLCASRGGLVSQLVDLVRAAAVHFTELELPICNGDGVFL